MTKIFINYRIDDEPLVPSMLDGALRMRFGADNVFLDSRRIPLGADFRPVLWGNLARSAVLLVIVGRKWLTLFTNGERRLDMPDDFVRCEIELAMKIGIPIVPILIGDTPRPTREDLPTSIEDLNFRQDFRVNSQTAEHDIQRLVDGLDALLAETQPGGPPTVTAPPVQHIGIQNNGPTTVRRDQIGGNKVVRGADRAKRDD